MNKQSNILKRMHPYYSETVNPFKSFHNFEKPLRKRLFRLHFCLEHFFKRLLLFWWWRTLENLLKQTRRFGSDIDVAECLEGRPKIEMDFRSQYQIMQVLFQCNEHSI